MVNSSYDRIVIKAGTSLLTSGTDHLDLKLMKSLVNQISDLHSQGTEMILVSSGAVTAGRQVLCIPKESKIFEIIKSITIKGINNKNPIWKAAFNSEIINAGTIT